MSRSGRQSAAAVVLSVIVPVYGVERYLRECLDSILAVDADEIEVVAVDDASPDGSAAILAAYAARDPRVTVVTHASNRGLGAARNTGLDHATGTYVWFVDSDDWLTEGAVAAVLERIARDTPDVLIVGYERSYQGGDRVPERLVPPGPPLPTTFSVREQPRLFKTLHIACNKIIRRDFLTALDVRFAPGWYEDVSFSHPLLLAAPRISVLDRVCYGYRQRPEGAITGTRTDRHFEVFDHWHRVFAFVDRGGHEDLRPLVFQRMIWHYLGVLNHPHRVAPDQRRAFFRAIVRDYREYRPAHGFPRPGGVADITFALVASDSFTLFETLRAVYRTRGVAGRVVAAARRATGHAYYWWQRRLPLRDAATVYASGAHDGFPGSHYARPAAEVCAAAAPLVNEAEVLVVLGDTRAVGAVPSGRLVRGRAALRAFARSRVLVADAALPPPVVVRPGQHASVIAEPSPVPSPRPEATAIAAEPAAAIAGDPRAGIAAEAPADIVAEAAAVIAAEASLAEASPAETQAGHGG